MTKINFLIPGFRFVLIFTGPIQADAFIDCLKDCGLDALNTMF